MSHQVAEIEVAELAQALQAGRGPVVLDVREPWEYAQGALPHAQLVPLSTLPQQVQTLSVPRDAQVVTYCHHGMRSLKAAQLLAEAGFAHVSSLAGGIDAWAVHVDPSIGRY
jgi:adenylyltransferase/sulfurtransferase